MVEHVVAGGGVYGTYVAWRLAESGADVLLLERESIGSGASSGPGKRGVRASGRDLRELPLMRRAYEIWPRLGDELGADVGYERPGQLQYVEREVPEIGPTTTASAPAQVRVQNAHGVPTEYLDAEAVREREPDVSEDVVGAVHTPKDGVVDHGALTEALAAAARRDGAEVVEGTGLADATVEKGRVAAVETTGGETIPVEGSLFVLTNPAVAGFLDAAFGVTLPTWNVAIQVVLTEPVERPRVRHLVAHSHRRLAVKAVADGRLMVTGGWTVEQDDSGGGRPDPAAVEANMAAAEAVYPDLADAEVAQVTSTHLESCCIDGIPVIDRVPGTANALAAAGWTGHGFAIAPAVGERLVEWAQRGERPDVLAPFSLDRFEEQREDDAVRVQ